LANSSNVSTALDNEALAITGGSQSCSQKSIFAWPRIRSGEESANEPVERPPLEPDTVASIGVSI